MYAMTVCQFQSILNRYNRRRPELWTREADDVGCHGAMAPRP